eukprot:gene16002-19040_t
MNKVVLFKDSGLEAWLNHKTKRPLVTAIENFELWNYRPLVHLPLQLQTTLFSQLHTISCQLGDDIPEDYFSTLSTKLSRGQITTFRASTLQRLTISMFHSAKTLRDFYLATFSVDFPVLTDLKFGALDSSEQFEWSLITQHMPVLASTGYFWRNQSAGNPEYEEAFVNHLFETSSIKYIGTNLALTPLIASRLEHNDHVMKWKFRVNRAIEGPVNFAPCVRQISLTFTGDGLLDLIDRIFKGLAVNNHDLTIMTLCDLPEVSIGALVSFLDLAGGNLTSLDLSIKGGKRTDYTGLAAAIGKLPLLNRLYFKGIYTDQQIQDIRSIQTVSSTLDTLFVHSQMALENIATEPFDVILETPIDHLINNLSGSSAQRATTL